MPRCLALRRAADLVGDGPLCLRLKVSMRDLYDWLAGRASPPTSAFLHAVDIIDAHDTPVTREGPSQENESLPRGALDVPAPRMPATGEAPERQTR